jgi:uncharacterized membrane protein AbrB (regulator of aidB expression)
MDRETATLAVMPGGLGEMIAAAGALGLLPATVAGFQITRSMLTNILAPQLIKLALARHQHANLRRHPARENQRKGPVE